MKILGIILLTSIVTLLIGAAVLQEICSQAATFRLANLQEQMTLVDLRCQKALHGSAGIICDDIGSEALAELVLLPNRDIIKQFHAKELQVLEAYERHEISEAEKNRVLDQIQIEVIKKLDADEANMYQSPFEFLFP